MADLSQIELPNGITYDLKDANAATESYVNTGLASKQNTLTAGTGISIDANNVISATGGGGNVDDVYVNGVSVLDSNKIAQIDLTGKVNKAGDTMTGNLIIKNATAGAVQITNPNTDLREADNNVSSVQSNQFRIVDDGSHMTMGYFGTTVYPEGLVQGTLQVSNFDTNGDPVSNSITLTVDKGGNNSYSVSDGAAFRRAIGVLNRPAANAGADLSLVTTGDKYSWNNKVSKSGDTMTGRLVMVGSASSQPIQTRGIVGSSVDGSALDALHLQYGNTVNDSVAFGNTAGGQIYSNGTKFSGSSDLNVLKSGDTMTGVLTMAGKDIELKTSGSSSNDSGDIVWYYGNGREKARLWTNDTYTAVAGINYRVYKNDGTALYTGTLLTGKDAILRQAWWTSGTSHNANDLRGSTVFAYSTHTNTATTGTLVSFDCSTNDNYTLQMQGNYSGNGLYFRNRNGDNGTWGAWRQIAHSGNVSTGDSNGQVKIAGANVSVKGLGTMAYQNTGSWQAALSSSAGSLSVTYNSTNATTNNDMWYAKYGNIVQLCGSVKNKNAITIPSHGDIGDLHMFTLPSGYHPKITTGGFADNGNLVAWRIASDGKVYLTDVYRSTGTWAAGAVFFIRATFIV